jgi:hypothetical protein
LKLANPLPYTDRNLTVSPLHNMELTSRQPAQLFDPSHIISQYVAASMICCAAIHSFGIDDKDCLWRITSESLIFLLISSSCMFPEAVQAKRHLQKAGVLSPRGGGGGTVPVNLQNFPVTHLWISALIAHSHPLTSLPSTLCESSVVSETERQRLLKNVRSPGACLLLLLLLYQSTTTYHGFMVCSITKGLQIFLSERKRQRETTAVTHAPKA